MNDSTHYFSAQDLLCFENKTSAPEKILLFRGVGVINDLNPVCFTFARFTENSLFVDFLICRCIGGANRKC